jgi:transcriptional regulator with GAF, ATPase, and Fis domain
LLAPVETDGQVFGVLELATLNQFSAEHEAFLQRVSESIAIAFRTTQTRVQINGLLAQSQQQAEELQAQEEELRAANEELHIQAETSAISRISQ